MDVLGFLASTTLTKELANRQDSQEFLMLTHETIAQVSPVDRLDVRSTSEQFTNEQNQLQNRVKDLQILVADLKMQQFSPTAFLEGEMILGINGVAGGNLDDSVVFQESIEFMLNMSFTGKDKLEVGIESGNAKEFSFVEKLTFEGRLGFLSNTDGDRFELSKLAYEFSIGDRASIYISTTGNDLSGFNPLGDRDEPGSGTISEFGVNPIYDLVENTGVQINCNLTDSFSTSLGYFSGEANDSSSGAGLFNGNQSAFVQLKFEPSDRFLLGFTYIHTYNDSSLETEIGSFRAQIDLERPVIGNSYGISTSFTLSPKFIIGGWAGFTNATVIDLGNAYVWNYALTLAFHDFGQQGNLLGIIIGQEPKLTGTNGFTIDDRRSDPDTSLHVELFYQHWLSDEISVTPGLVWVTAPNHDNSNPDFAVFALRTTFEF
jgi:Carbohydrate-selective porin, OprB family